MCKFFKQRIILNVEAMAVDKKMLSFAAEIATKVHDKDMDNRTFLFGAVGIRKDGVIVTSRNIAAPDFAPDHHAETRLVRKLTPGSTVWITRIARKDGMWALARPCPGCENRLRSAGVSRVIYTIGPNEWGVLDLKGKTNENPYPRRRRRTS